MNECEELSKVIQALKMVSVTGDYWVIMQACVNSLTKVIESLRGKENAISNNPEP